jgi:hypothetical protein
MPPSQSQFYPLTPCAFRISAVASAAEKRPLARLR